MHAGNLSIRGRYLEFDTPHGHTVQVTKAMARKVFQLAQKVNRGQRKPIVPWRWLSRGRRNEAEVYLSYRFARDGNYWNRRRVEIQKSYIRLGCTRIPYEVIVRAIKAAKQEKYFGLKELRK